ncbi:MAG: M20 family metallopeptidase [Clostridia bacterium]|nr:M20 family metallopeptidase [Clostridia bacterium]
MDIKKICDIIEERQDELFTLLSKLININSESFVSHGNEEECARFIYNYCKDLELECDFFSPLELEDFESHPDYMPGRGLENRYNVVARYRGEEDVDEVMIMAHTDTVRIGDLADWEEDPLSGKIKDGKIYGRGAGDDKYALATGMFLMKLFKELGFKPKKNFLFSAYSDEEYGGSHGALSTVLKYPAPRIISMDCDNSQIWHCASGGQEIKYLFHTKEVVDSALLASKGASAVVDIIEETFAANRRKEMAENRFYKGTIIPETSLRYMGVRAGNNGNDLGKGEVYFVFYTDKTKDEIWAELKELELVISKKLEPLGIVGDGFKGETRFFHYAFCEPDSEDVKLLIESSVESTGVEPVVCGSCLSDLSVISKYGSSKAFGYGIGRDFSEIGGSHQPNEFIECDKFLEFTKTIATYIIKVLN